MFEERYTLSNVKMNPHFSMVRDGYGCDVLEYDLNGETHHGSMPDLIKVP